MEQLARLKKKDSLKRLERMSVTNVPACVLVKKGDASDAGELLQVGFSVISLGSI